MGDGEEVGGEKAAEEVIAPGAAPDPEAVKQPDTEALSPPPESEEASDPPGVARLKQERDEERMERFRLQAQLEVLSAQSRERKPGNQEMTPEQRRAAFEADPFLYTERQRAEERAEREELKAAIELRRNGERADEILVSAPERKNPGFKAEMREILDEIYPGDTEGRGIPFHVQAAVALKEYRHRHTPKVAGTITQRIPPPTGKGAVASTSAKSTPPTVEEMEEVRSRFNDEPDANGLGWGARKHAEWARKGLV